MQAIKEWIFRHPSLSAWIVLAIGMNAILIYEARDVGLASMQWFWLILITTLVAGPVSGSLVGEITRTTPPKRPPRISLHPRKRIKPEHA
jgi:hypothetical protein